MQPDLKAISVDPKAYFFFPNGTSEITQKRNRKLASIRMGLDSSSMDRLNTMNLRKAKLPSSRNSLRKTITSSIVNFGQHKKSCSSFQEIATRTNRHMKQLEIMKHFEMITSDLTMRR